MADRASTSLAGERGTSDFSGPGFGCSATLALVPQSIRLRVSASAFTWRRMRMLKLVCRKLRAATLGLRLSGCEGVRGVREENIFPDVAFSLPLPSLSRETREDAPLQPCIRNSSSSLSPSENKYYLTSVFSQANLRRNMRQNSRRTRTQEGPSAGEEPQALVWTSAAAAAAANREADCFQWLLVRRSRSRGCGLRRVEAVTLAQTHKPLTRREGRSGVRVASRLVVVGTEREKAGVSFHSLVSFSSSLPPFSSLPSILCKHEKRSVQTSQEAERDKREQQFAPVGLEASL